MFLSLSNLQRPVGNKFKKRLGRGDSSGHGGTSTKGHKGQKSRSGGYHKLGFEGGQMPLIRRIPKRGFYNPFRKEFSIVNIESLNEIAKGSVVDPVFLKQNGYIKNLSLPVKILANGDFSNNITIKAHQFSKSAIAKIEKAGSNIEILK